MFFVRESQGLVLNVIYVKSVFGIIKIFFLMFKFESSNAIEMSRKDIRSSRRLFDYFESYQVIKTM